jgi:hypothetical protein
MGIGAEADSILDGKYDSKPGTDTSGMSGQEETYQPRRSGKYAKKGGPRTEKSPRTIKHDPNTLAEDILFVGGRISYLWGGVT